MQKISDADLEMTSQVPQQRRTQLPMQEMQVPWVGKIPWRRKWQPTPTLLLGKFHGQRSLAGYNPWDHEESDTTEHSRT